MGDRRRERAQAHHQLHAEAAADIHDFVGELAPAHVRLGTDQHEDAPARRVGAPSQFHLGPGEPRIDPVHDAHDRPPGSLVEQ